MFFLFLLIVSPIFSAEIPLEWQQQCSFSHLPITGEEGSFKGATLRGITILFRHGERSGLLEYSDPTGCPPFTPEDDLSFQKLKDEVASSSFQQFIGMHVEKLGNYSLIANNTLLCFDETCHCPFAQNIWRQAHQEEYKIFLEIALPEVIEIARNLTKIPTFATSHEGYQIIDTALTRFICRKRELPCHEDTCLTYGVLDKIKNFTTARGVYWYKKAEYMRGLVDDIKTSNFFSQFFKRVDGLDASSSFIDVVSAHDVTIGALFHSLGVEFPDPPRYTSRVVFEVFQRDEKFLFRMLFNGEDWTKKLSFCTKEDLCPIEGIRTFLAGLKKNSEICIWLIAFNSIPIAGFLAVILVAGAINFGIALLFQVIVLIISLIWLIPCLIFSSFSSVFCYFLYKKVSNFLKTRQKNDIASPIYLLTPPASPLQKEKML